MVALRAILLPLSPWHMTSLLTPDMAAEPSPWHTTLPLCFSTSTSACSSFHISDKTKWKWNLTAPDTHDPPFMPLNLRLRLFSPAMQKIFPSDMKDLQRSSHHQPHILALSPSGSKNMCIDVYAHCVCMPRRGEAATFNCIGGSCQGVVWPPGGWSLVDRVAKCLRYGRYICVKI